jgi:hypothetical protein
MLCLEHAEAMGLRHGQLPLGVYLSSMPTRKVLTVNHVRRRFLFPYLILFL